MSEQEFSQEILKLNTIVKDLDERLRASNDLTLFLLASIRSTDAALCDGLLDQFEEMKQSNGDGMSFSHHFENLLHRAVGALSDSDTLELDSVE